MACPIHSPLAAKGLHAAPKTDGRTAFWKDVEARRQPFYGPYSRKAKEARDKIAERAVSAIEDSRLPQFAVRAAQDAVSRDDTPIRDFVRDTYRTVGLRFARDELEAVQEKAGLKTKADIEDTWFDEVERWLGTEGAQEVRAISDTTRRDIVRILTDAREDGLGTEEMAKLLEEEMEEANRRRGRVIARTEVITASNKASQHGAKQSRLTLEKEWVDSADARVRLSHEEVDGQRQAMDDPYVWTSPKSGRVQAAYPADPSLPAAERIQCRCVETHHPV
jgi:SPP1 gp7 family putative phage head morphogenesis protein